jgi:uncharacterized membrane protein
MRSRLTFPRLTWRVVLIAVIVTVLGFGPYLGTTRASGGWLKFKNETSSRVDVAVWYLDEAQCGADGWMSEGWWNLDPGEEATTIQMGSNSYYGYYAQSTDGGEWSSASYGAWVPSRVFTECRYDNRSYSPGSDYRWVGMKVFQVDDTDRGFIMSLTSPGGSGGGNLDGDVVLVPID